MAGRTHQRETFSTAQRQIHRNDCRSGSTSSVVFNFGIVRSIRVKIDRLPKALKVFWAMDSQIFLFGGEPRFHPDPIRALVQKVSLGVYQPGRVLRMIIVAKLGGGFVKNQSEHRSLSRPFVRQPEGTGEPILEIMSRHRPESD